MARQVHPVHWWLVVLPNRGCMAGFGMRIDVLTSSFILRIGCIQGAPSSCKAAALQDTKFVLLLAWYVKIAWCRRTNLYGGAPRGVRTHGAHNHTCVIDSQLDLIRCY